MITNIAPAPDRREMGDAAREYAQRGWAVFPLLRASKRPMYDRGFHAATADVAQVEQWWAATPYANIGLAPAASGLVVVDIDTPAAEAIADALGMLIPTATVRTGRDGFDGRHLYFRHPGFPVTNRKIRDVLDMRGDHGYVVAPPSLHPTTGRRYEFTDHAPIAPLPAAAVAELQSMREPARVIGTIPTAPVNEGQLAVRIRAYLARVPRVPEGQRNDAAYRVAAWLVRDMALGQADALGWLCSWNAGCTPPLPAKELETILRSAQRHARHVEGEGLHRERAAPARLVFTRWRTP